MSILIKGMEMPTSCRYCHFEDTYDGYNCRINEKSYNWGIDGRPSDCPLVPVPPHGRLIDADAYMRTHAGGEMLKFAPTIIPAEEGEA